ncbi:MAG: NUDIX hydrolase [Rhodobacter sp.]|nr:NUDIX hydrolase [Rhodobacter sp.]
MSIAKPKMRPIRLPNGLKSDVRTQFGALCYRIRNDKVQVLLVTSRGTGRWIVPKGWPIDGATPVEAALREAWEEAGVEGKVTGNALGIYSYVKRDDGEHLPCVVAVFPVRVKRLADTYPEAKERRRKWLSLKKAATLLDEPELRQILQGFDPRGAAQ